MRYFPSPAPLPAEADLPAQPTTPVEIRECWRPGRVRHISQAVLDAPDCDAFRKFIHDYTSRPPLDVAEPIRRDRA